jgi:hypothetical protein
MKNISTFLSSLILCLYGISCGVTDTNENDNKTFAAGIVRAKCNQTPLTGIKIVFGHHVSLDIFTGYTEFTDSTTAASDGAFELTSSYEGEQTLYVQSLGEAEEYELDLSDLGAGTRRFEKYDEMRLDFETGQKLTNLDIQLSCLGTLVITYQTDKPLVQGDTLNTTIIGTATYGPGLGSDVPTNQIVGFVSAGGGRITWWVNRSGQGREYFQETVTIVPFARNDFLLTY